MQRLYFSQYIQRAHSVAYPKLNVYSARDLNTIIMTCVETSVADSVFAYRSVNQLGSGQFGWVDKGMWHSPEGPVEVAIKTLKAEASEEERVKFLQEAAIMGQFHHPNVVKLHGVVTVGDPVSVVLIHFLY